ncbi:MAG: bifunctional hydroxymethylpyrimidine kinase/phosphomethylpyrimidine kinase [Sulfurihydrogenibium azorense]
MIAKALTIAGSDSGGGAGIQADLKTFTALGVYGMSAITAITVQNTVGVFGVHPVPPDIVYGQIKAVAEDIGIDALKTGMLFSQEIIEVVSQAIKDFNLNNLVLDPVMIAKSGDPLLKEFARKTLLEKLLPLALIVTPNIPEAEDICKMEIKSIEDMEKACKIIHSLGSKYIVLKGGHLEGDVKVDVIYDGKEFHYLKATSIPTKNTHGTGCTFSAAITSFLAKGESPIDAIKKAREYIQGAIENSLSLGKGHGPLNHTWNLPVSFSNNRVNTSK